MILHFRQGPGRGYSLYHWFGPTWSRIDLYRHNTLAETPIRMRLESTGAPKIALPQPHPIRWRLSAKGPTFALYRNKDKIWEYTDTGRPTLEAGAISFDIDLNTKDPTAPMYFDDIRVESDDPGIGDKFRRVFYFHRKVPGHFVAAHANIFHQVQIHELVDTGLDRLWSGLPKGRIYRVTAAVNFPDMEVVQLLSLSFD